MGENLLPEPLEGISRARPPTLGHTSWLALNEACRRGWLSHWNSHNVNKTRIYHVDKQESQLVEDGVSLAVLSAARQFHVCVNLQRGWRGGKWLSEKIPYTLVTC